MSSETTRQSRGRGSNRRNSNANLNPNQNNEDTTGGGDTSIQDNTTSQPTVLLTQNFGDPIKKLTYETVQRIVSFYKKQKLAGKSFQITELMDNYVKFSAYGQLKGKALISETVTTMDQFLKLPSDELVEALERAYPKPEHKGVGAAELAQKANFMLYPNNPDLIDHIIEPIYVMAVQESLSEDQEKAIVQILITNLEDKSEGASAGYINQFKNEVKEKSPKTILDFNVVMMTVHAKIENEIDIFKNAYGADVSFPKKFYSDIPIAKKQKIESAGKSQSGYNAKTYEREKNPDSKPSNSAQHCNATIQQENTDAHTYLGNIPTTIKILKLPLRNPRQVKHILQNSTLII